MKFCNKIIPTRSQYASIADHKCHCREGHEGECDEFPNKSLRRLSVMPQ